MYTTSSCATELWPRAGPRRTLGGARGGAAGFCRTCRALCGARQLTELPQVGSGWPRRAVVQPSSLLGASVAPFAHIVRARGVPDPAAGLPPAPRHTRRVRSTAQGGVVPKRSAGGKRGGGEIGSNCDPPAPARCALRAHTRVRRLVLLRALAARRSSRIPGRGCAAMSRAPIAGSETDGPPSLFETSLAVLCRAVWAGDLRDLSERPLPEEALMRMFKVSAGAQNAARRSRSGAWKERWPRSQRAHRERARLCVARRWAVRQARALTRARTPCLRASWRAHTRALRPTNSCR